MSGKIYFTKQRNVDPWRARKNSHLFSWDSVVILSVKSYFVNSHVKLTNPDTTLTTHNTEGFKNTYFFLFSSILLQQAKEKYNGMLIPVRTIVLICIGITIKTMNCIN